ncbi:MAG: FAD-binding oxidoreductase [Burkholderiales bacterium]|nr:FAD-binding oxidoreductase [Burkholderiales bacterium]
MDVAVLGAGMVGVCVALHLQKRGRAVALIDRRGAAEETSFGNAGMIQREAVFPHPFPREFGVLLRYARNRSIDASYHLAALPRIAPFLWRYRRHSQPQRYAEIARAYARLIAPCVAEHDVLAADAGATGLMRRDGWIRLYRTTEKRDAGFADAERARRDFGVDCRTLDARAVRALEPSLTAALAGGIHWIQPTTVADPQALALAYLRRFESLGGLLLQGDAATLETDGSGWRIAGARGPINAASAVIALGPWSDVVTRALGYELPLAVKRGYHMHYRPHDGATLNHPVVDSENGFCLAPMARGIRLTTGAEFALRDAAHTPVQLERAEPVARGLFPLGDRLDAEPWMGARPCTPDMLPIIGPAPRHDNLWFAFGHAHQGFTLGAVTGRLIAEMAAGEQPFLDPAPYRAERFLA